VAVFERETVAWGRRRATAGWPPRDCPWGSGTRSAKYGFPTASTLYLTYYDAIDSIEKTVGEEGIDCDFARTGKLNLAAKPAHFDGLRNTHDVLAERLGIETHLVAKSELRSEIGSDHYHGGMVDPRGAGLHVGKFTRGLAEAAARMGARIHEKAPVQQVRRLGGTRHELTTPRGSVRADQVLMASSGYTGRPFRWLQVRLAPVGSFISVTERLGKEVCDEIMPTRRMASDSKNLLHYFRITPDYRLLFGGRAQFAMSSPQSDERSGRILRKAMVSVFPQLANARVDYCWGGLVDMSMDRLVHAGSTTGCFTRWATPGTGCRWPPTWAGRWRST
jgi:glycine/D-amino acid oxidase-like deaminating enzyme